ncbi:MAG: microviridin/marinostatin family tricyclic proteinase inhibitor [Desmonostoc vinosum HA7617-LM4]|jgi:hypothetical protein|nr:microviridin/marinostatin family tricyclic proteinase inhibitor [Desmonostoc vinosum HA7617-LM4]
MSTNVVKESDIQAVPFFARFLGEQAAQSDLPSDWGVNTLKYPSDWEEY